MDTPDPLAAAVTAAAWLLFVFAVVALSGLALFTVWWVKCYRADRVGELALRWAEHDLKRRELAVAYYEAMRRTLAPPDEARKRIDEIYQSF